MKDIKLFCLPYAGGSAVMYNSLEKYINEVIEIIPLEYSGHGERILL
ncbi:MULTISPECIES: thioesterase domain-containing protein [unclassified Lysinibacillus]